MPAVQVAVAQIREKAGEPDAAAYHKRPPCPRFAAAQGKERQPEVEHADSHHRPSERSSVVNHEVDDAAAFKRTEIARAQAQKSDVVGEELTRSGQKDGKPTSEKQRHRSCDKKRAAVADDPLKEADVLPARFGHPILRSKPWRDDSRQSCQFANRPRRLVR